MADERPRRKPENRPYRLLVVGAYLFLSVAFSVGVTVSVVSSVWATGEVQSSAVDRAGEGLNLSTLEGCLGEVSALAGRLAATSHALLVDAGTSGGEPGWTRFREGWRERADQVRRDCVVGAAAEVASRTAPVLARLEALGDAYDTHAAQAATSLGPALVAFDDALRKAKGEARR